MSPNKTTLRLIIVTQVFTLFAVLLMPVLIRILDETSGMVLYALLILISVGLTLALRYALISLD
ncbi:MAG: hypothetical protein WC859_00650 [Elusimicrobiota bacterium]|jgi:hypothetical protein